MVAKIKKLLLKLINKTVYGKTWTKLRNIIDVKPASNEKGYLKGTAKPSYMSQKIIFDNDLVAIRKGKVTLKPTKLTYVWIFTLGLIWLHWFSIKFHYDYIDVRN